MRLILQYTTFCLIIVIMTVLFLMAYRRVIGWRYIVLPSLVMMQLLVFYMYVIVTEPPPSETVTTWSAIIRLETYTAFLVVLLLYWKSHGDR